MAVRVPAIPERDRMWDPFASMTVDQGKQSDGKAKWPFSQTFHKHISWTPSCWKIGLLSFHISVAIEVHFLIIYCKLQAEKVGRIWLEPIYSWSSFASSEGLFKEWLSSVHPRQRNKNAGIETKSLSSELRSKTWSSACLWIREDSAQCTQIVRWGNI